MEACTFTKKNYARASMQTLRIIWVFKTEQIHGINEIKKEIKNFSMTTDMTFYDSAYVIATKRVGLDLVTDDKSLARTAAKYLTVMNSNDI